MRAIVWETMLAALKEETMRKGLLNVLFEVQMRATRNVWQQGGLW